MKKKVLSVVLFICSIVALFCLWNNNLKEAEAAYSPRFQYVESVGGDMDIYYDKATNVCYLVFDKRFGYGGAGGVCVLVDSDGKPLLYNN